MDAIVFNTQKLKFFKEYCFYVTEIKFTNTISNIPLLAQNIIPFFVGLLGNGDIQGFYSQIKKTHKPFLLGSLGNRDPRMSILKVKTRKPINQFYWVYSGNTNRDIQGYLFTKQDNPSTILL